MLNHKSLGNYCTLLLVAFAAPLSALALDMPARPASPVIPDRTVTLNAPNDGITDATAAINNAIASLAKQGGGTLQFPAGTYLVHANPNAVTSILQLASRVRLMGSTSGTSTILLAAKQPPYEALLDASDANSATTDVEIEDLTIDLNGQNNPITSKSDLFAGERNAIRVFNGARFRIAFCTIENAADGNTVNFNDNVLPNAAVTDIEMLSNTFRGIGQPKGSFDYDHSTIYAHAVRVWLHINSMSTLEGPGTPLGRTAIETHGDDMNASQNKIDGYSLGMIMSGAAASSNRQLYRYNVITNVLNGMELYSTAYENAPIGLQNVTIEHNQISLNPNAWRATSSADANLPSEGIFLWSSEPDPAPLIGLAILNNTITFPAEQGPPISDDRYSGGIVFWSGNGLMVPISNLTISGNTVTNSLGAAILSNTDLTEGTSITLNTVTNPARSSDSVDRTGIFISAKTSNIQIQNNSVTDTANPPLIESGTDAASTCESNCTASGNTVSPTTLPATILGPGWSK